MKFDYEDVSPLVVWEITLDCNLNCLHCGSSAGKARPNELTTKEALSLCQDFADIGVDEVCLMGGEPLIRKDWFEISKKIKDLGMKLDIITNGFHKNREELVSKLSKLEPFVVGISIDGSNEKIHDRIRKKGSFKLATEFLSNLKKENIDTSIITTVNKINFKDIPKIKDLILGKQIAWQIQTGSPLGRFSKKYALSNEEFYALGLFIAKMKKEYSKKELPVIGAHGLGYYSKYIPSLALYEKWLGCPAGLITFGVQSDGGIKGCLSTPDYLIEGNCRERSIRDIWYDPNSFTYNRNFLAENLGNNCKNCEHSNVCRGGCISISTALTGGLHNDPWCFHRLEKILEKNKKDPNKLLNLIIG